jgi:hypothetical protein
MHEIPFGQPKWMGPGDFLLTVMYMDGMGHGSWTRYIWLGRGNRRGEMVMNIAAPEKRHCIYMKCKRDLL